MVVTKDGRVVEVFRNSPDPVTGLRNGGTIGSQQLEFPTSPFLLGDLFCTANSDGSRRDNFPSTDGEINPSGPSRGKISCLHDRLNIPGLLLPVQLNR